MIKVTVVQVNIFRICVVLLWHDFLPHFHCSFISFVKTKGFVIYVAIPLDHALTFIENEILRLLYLFSSLSI